MRARKSVSTIRDKNSEGKDTNKKQGTKNSEEERQKINVETSGKK